MLHCNYYDFTDKRCHALFRIQDKMLQILKSIIFKTNLQKKTVSVFDCANVD